MTIYYCHPGLGTGSNDGTSWENAYRSIAEALVGATTGSEIWVKESTTTLTAALSPQDDNLTIYGGFSSALTGTDGSVAGRSFLSDITEINGVNTYQIWETEGITGYTIDGFTMKNGIATKGGCNYVLSNTTGTFRNCYVYNCNGATDATGTGGAFAVNSGDAGNTATLTIDKCIIEACHAGYSGAVNTSTFPNNLTLTDTVIIGCYSTTGGGGAVRLRSSIAPTIARVWLIDCYAATNGGAVQIFSGGVTTTLVNCVISNCDANNGAGGAIWTDQSIRVVNCTIAGGSATTYGGGVYRSAGTTTITNCILYGNTAGTSGNQIYGTTTTTYSDVEGGYTGTGNIDAAPVFRSTYSGHIYEHLDSSACIDAANSSATGYSATDIVGRSRYDDPLTANTGTGTINYADMGAYEYQGKSSLFPAMQ